MSDNISLIAKIAKASIDVGNFTADKKNQEQGYSYISADQVLSRAGNALAQQGIVVLPELVGIDITTVERQGKSPRIDAKVSFMVVVTDGEKDINIPWFGYGSDYSTPDKALYKAITSGHKYFLMKLLNIGVGNEDSEHESSDGPDVRSKATASRKPAQQSAQQQAAAPSAQPAMTYDQAKQVIVKTTSGEKFIGEMSLLQLEAVIANSKQEKAVEAAKIVMKQDHQQVPAQ